MERMQFARLVTKVTGWCGFCLTQDQLHELDDLVRPQPTQVQIYAREDMVKELMREMKYASSHGFIPAIKAYRALTGVGLKEAKDAVEKFR